MDLFPCERFSPMDDELLLYYLEPKVNGKPVPGVGKVIFEEDLYGEDDPWKTYKKYEAERANDLRKTKDLFLFTKLKNSSANRMKRTVGSGGTWKGQAKGKPVYLLDEKYQKETTTLLGYKKTFTYKNDKSPQDGCWIMYQFELDESRVIKNDNKKNDVHVVLCQLRKNDEEKKLPRKRGHQERVDDVEEEEEYPQEKRVRASFQGDQDQFLKPSSSSQAEKEGVLSSTLEDDQVVQGGYGVVDHASLQHSSMEVEPNSVVAEQEQALEPYRPPSSFDAEKEEALVASTPIKEDGKYEFFGDFPEVDWEYIDEIMRDDEELRQALCFKKPDDQQQAQEEAAIHNVEQQPPPLDVKLLISSVSAGCDEDGGVQKQQMGGEEANKEGRKMGDAVGSGIFSYMSREDLMKIEEALMKIV